MAAYLTTQPSTSKLSDNPEYLLLFLWFSLLLGLKICKETSQGPYDFFCFFLIQLLLYLQEFSQKMISQTHEIETQVDGLVNSTKVSQQATKSLMTRIEMTEITGQINKRHAINFFSLSIISGLGFPPNLNYHPGII